MIPWWVLLLALIVFSLVIAQGVRYFARGAADESFTLGVEAGAARCIQETLALNRAKGVRVLIDVNDFGEEWGEVRWHWTLWDADRYLLPGTQELGCTRPYREGAAPLQGLAYSQALQAIATMREEAGVNIQVVTR